MVSSAPATDERAGSGAAERPDTNDRRDGSRYLVDGFAPVMREVQGENLKVIGELPRDLNGVYLRNGPNPAFPTKPYHWFDGDGHLHAVRFAAGEASYSNRFVRTRGYEMERAAGRALWESFIGQESLGPGGMLRALGGALRTGEIAKNAANTSVVHHHGRTFALWEAGPPTEMRLRRGARSAVDFETVGPYSFAGQGWNGPFTAHPKVDPVTGEMIAIGYGNFPGPFVSHGVVGPDGRVTHQTRVEVAGQPMIHDFAITERYSIIPDLPFLIDLGAGFAGRPHLYFDAGRPARFGVLPRRAPGSEIRWFEAPSCFVFHFLNAYEEGDEVVVVGCRYRSMDLQMIADAGDRDRGAQLHEWRLDLASGAVRERQLDPSTTEYPIVSPAVAGRPFRYGYLARTNPRLTKIVGVRKVDLQAGTADEHMFEPGLYAGEPLFVPRPDGTAEDDGYVITLAHDDSRETSEALVYDAGRVAAGPVARVQLPNRVPYGFHGTFVPE
eukprot:tig00001208_g7526.t1